MKMRVGSLPDHRGMSLVEVIVSLAIFSFVMAALMVVFLASDKSWQAGQNKLVEQQEARRMMDNMVFLLRQTHPDWVNITASGYLNQDRISFNEPQFDAGGNMTQGGQIDIGPNAIDHTQIRMRRNGTWHTIGQNNVKLLFGGGCANCANYTCSSPDATCPVIKIEIGTLDGQGFNMTTYVNLRNAAAAAAGSEPAPPDAGEF